MIITTTATTKLLVFPKAINNDVKRIFKLHVSSQWNNQSITAKSALYSS